VKKYLDFDHSSYYLLASTPIEEDSRKVIFRDWLIEEMQSTYQNLYKKFGDLK
jgi:hypothetical protein